MKAGRLRSLSGTRFRLRGSSGARLWAVGDAFSARFLRFLRCVDDALVRVCGVLLAWRVLLLLSVDVMYLFRYGRDMADHGAFIMV